MTEMEPTGADYAMDVSTIDTLKLVEALRNVAAYDEMGQLAEAISRRDPRDAKNRCLYAQYLINTGKATAAIGLLTPLKERLAEDDPELAEVRGPSCFYLPSMRPMRRKRRSPRRSHRLTDYIVTERKVHRDLSRCTICNSAGLDANLNPIAR